MGWDMQRLSMIGKPETFSSRMGLEHSLKIAKVMAMLVDCNAESPESDR